MSWSASDWIYSHGELPNPPGDNRFESSEVGPSGLEPEASGVPRIFLRCTDSTGARCAATP